MRSAEQLRFGGGTLRYISGGLFRPPKFLNFQPRFLTWPRDCEFLACKQKPVISAEAEVKGEPAIPVAKKMP